MLASQGKPGDDAARFGEDSRLLAYTTLADWLLRTLDISEMAHEKHVNEAIKRVIYLSKHTILLMYVVTMRCQTQLFT